MPVLLLKNTNKLNWNFLASIFLPKSKFSKNIKSIVGYYPNNAFFYKLAMVHKSMLNHESKKYKKSNERLEFLGDSILNSVISEYLYQKYPEMDEGELTKVRSKLVSREMLNKLAVEIGLSQFVIAKIDKNAHSSSIFGNAYEALIGALYLDKGFKKTKQFIISNVVEKHLNMENLVNTEVNFKSKAIEYAQKEKIIISFEILEEIGFGREKEFVAGILVDGEIKAQAKDYSKKKAEQKAAEIFCNQLPLFPEEGTQNIEL